MDFTWLPEAPQSAETLGAVKSSLLQRSSATAGGGGRGFISGYD